MEIKSRKCVFCILENEDRKREKNIVGNLKFFKDGEIE